jgi:hypothetical protein
MPARALLRVLLVVGVLAALLPAVIVTPAAATSPSRAPAAGASPAPDIAATSPARPVDATPTPPTGAEPVPVGPIGTDGTTDGRNLTSVVPVVTGPAGNVALDGAQDAIGSIAEDAAGSVADSALKQVSNAFAQGTASLVGSINTRLTSTTTPKFSGKGTGWFRDRYAQMFGIAITITIIFGMFSIATSAWRGDPSGVASTIGYMIAAVAITGSATAFVALALQFTDAFSTVLMRGYEDNTREFLLNLTSLYQNATTGGQVTTGDLALGLVLSLVTILGALIVLVILLVRGAMLYGIVLFVPLLFAAWVWPATRSIFYKGVRWTAMLILVKFVMFTLLAAGAGAIASATAPAVGAGKPAAKVQAATKQETATDRKTPAKPQATPAVAADQFLVVATFGAGAIWLAAFSPILLLSILPSGASGQAQQSIGKASGAAKAGVMKMAPVAGTAGAAAVSGAGTAMAGAARVGASLAQKTSQSLQTLTSRSGGANTGAPPSAAPGAPGAPNSVASGGISSAAQTSSMSAGTSAVSPIPGVSSPSGSAPDRASGAAAPSGAGPEVGSGSPSTPSGTRLPPSSGARSTASTGPLGESTLPHVIPRRGVQARPSSTVRPTHTANGSFIKGV